MVYEKFQETLTGRLQLRLGSEYRLQIQKVPKNNGLILDGLSISLKGQAAAPMIYLNQYYERFLEGRPLDALVEEIADIYREHSDILHVDFSILNDFQQLKGRIAYRLVNTDANRLLLEDLPSVPFLDLSLVFYLFLESGPFGQMTALIHRRHQKLWNVTTEELFLLAQENTPLLFPAELKSMTQVMQDIAREQDQDANLGEALAGPPNGRAEPPLYVLSTTAGLNGACTMLYPDILKNFANRLDRDLVILPSSIHEVLLIPYEDKIQFGELAEMVAYINETEVAVEDRLSDHIYFYSRAADEIVIAQDPASALTS